MLNKEALKKELQRESIHVDGAMNHIGENYIDVFLGDSVKVYDVPYLDVTTSSPTRTLLIPEEGLILKPNELYLGRTEEYTKTHGFVPMLCGTEELATIGMEIHITAGFGDNGFQGTWTLEIVCTQPTRVFRNMKIGRIYYIPLIGDPNITYQGKYLGQVEPTESRLSREYAPKKVLRMEMGDKNANK